MRSSVVIWAGLWLPQVLLAAPPATQRAEPHFAGEPLKIQGFGTVGGAYNTDGGAEYIRDRSQPNGTRGDGFGWAVDTRLGIQATWRPSESVAGILQLVTKQRYDGTWRPQVSWAFLKHAFDPDTELRVGRLGYDVYPMSDSRDVGYSYLWVRPPVDYFGQVHYSHIDGLDLTSVHLLGDGVVRGKLFAGQLNESGATPQGGEYDMRGSTLWGGYVEYQDPHWQIRGGGGVMRLEHAYPLYRSVQEALEKTGVAVALALADELCVRDKEMRFFAAGVAYDNGPLQSQFQLRYLDSETPAYAGNIAGYWSVGYRFGRWTPYIVYSRIESEHPDPDTGFPDTPEWAPLDAAVDQVVEATQADQDTLSLGARFDFVRNAALKLQIDWTESRDNPSLLWLDADPSWDGSAVVLSASVDFIF